MKRKPECPKCGSKSVIPIEYGYPTNELIEASKRNEALIGGCIVDDDYPSWYCLVCENKFRDKK